MRGIPRRAVSANLPILNTPFRAQDIADLERMCPWNDDMAGIDMSRPGAQAYYDSIFALYAAWEVDYIKADDMLYPYHAHEIEGVRRAIDAVNRLMVLSLSPGVNMTIDHSKHLKKHCELFRISGDFWDRWEDLKSQFEKCRVWSPYTGPGCWADADMLPLGHIGIRAERGNDPQSLLTRAEQITLMTLWAISRSPLMFGGDLPSSDDFTLTLLTNDEVLQVNQACWDNQELMHQGDLLAWTAQSLDSDDLYLALFNIGEVSTTPIEIDLTSLGSGTNYHIRDLWEKTDLGVTHGILRETIEPHAARLYRLQRA